MMTITVDTNSINARNADADLNVLYSLQTEGKIKIVATERLLQETTGNARLKAESFEYVGEPFVLGVSPLGSVDLNRGGRLVSVEDLEDKPSFSTIAGILFPTTAMTALTLNQKNDVMHLLAHVFSNSEVFVTNDHDFLDDNRKGFGENYKKERFLKEFGIKVLLCRDFLVEIKKST